MERQRCKNGCERPVHGRKDLCKLCYQKALYHGHDEIRAVKREAVGQVDEAAMAEIVARWETPLRRYAGHWLRDSQQVEEVVQDTFLGLWRTGTPDHLRAYLYKACANGCMDKLRKLRSRGGHSATAPLEDAVTIGTPDPTDDILDRMEAPGEIRRILATLKPDLVDILIMSAQGMEYTAISARLGIPIGTVKSRLNFARAQARKLRSA